ncbi:ABC transporter ATP-binding protein [Sporosarcina sp. FSL W7-1349]|uniref:ABC transporter ATP-binding protein n=1 Tax=Sporosarcina sp. FSL W7-1349 TaxID=2921561 RepID=UPI004046BB3F
MEFLSVKNVSKTFGNFTALNDINISIQKGEFVCLLGPSGCGKTTLLRLIAGLEEPNVGSQIVMDGKDITKLPPAKRDFGIVFQSYALFPNMTVFQNVAYGLKIKKLSKNDIREKVKEALSIVNLAHLMDRYPGQLSGGQQQRVALARALAISPSFLLLDEPLSALDAKVRVKLRMEIRGIQEKLGITTIMVTHDQEEALTMGDKIVVMNNASLEQVGTPQEIYENPATPFVADFIGTVNQFQGTGSYVAIRPEHITISRQPKKGAIQTTLRALEFRGSSYRLYMEVENGGPYQFEDEYLMSDIPTTATRGLDIQVGQVLYAELPDHQLIKYGTETHAEGMPNLSLAKVL